MALSASPSSWRAGAPGGGGGAGPVVEGLRCSGRERQRAGEGAIGGDDAAFLEGDVAAIGMGCGERRIEGDGATGGGSGAGEAGGAAELGEVAEVEGEPGPGEATGERACGKRDLA